MRQLDVQANGGGLSEKAPLLAASMMPGPPPDMTEKPESDNKRAICSVSM
jgi:hypothetical protein